MVIPELGTLAIPILIKDDLDLTLTDSASYFNAIHVDQDWRGDEPDILGSDADN
jgi:hypothetical protein